jgi:hypothetical protein
VFAELLNAGTGLYGNPQSLMRAKLVTLQRIIKLRTQREMRIIEPGLSGLQDKIPFLQDARTRCLRSSLSGKFSK